MYFARISRSRPKLVKRPNAWANTDDQVTLFAQLCCIASNCSRVIAETERGEVQGVTGWPDTESMKTNYAPLDPETPPPNIGETVHLVARNQRIHYRYETQVIALDELNRWILAPPTVITSYDRRGMPRHNGRGWRVVLRRMGTMGQDISANVLDISIGGLSMLVPQDGFHLQRARPHVGLLLGPGGARLSLRATVCHSQPWERSELPKLAIGATFDGFGVVNHARLARILASQRS